MLSRHGSFFIILGVASALLGFCLFYTNSVPASEIVVSTNQKQKYFCTFPLTISSDNSPYVLTTIDGKSFSMLLDLGLRGQFSLLSKHLEGISSKKLVRTGTICNFRGADHLCNFYTIPKVSIRAASWSSPLIQDRTEQYAQETAIDLDESAPFNQPDGAIGWLLFRDMNLFLDLGNSSAAVCDGLDTLREHGYSVDSWVRTPLLIDRGMVEIEVTTPEGLNRCFLDTGTTWNVLNKELPDTPITKACYDSRNFAEYPYFKIGETDLGPIVFRQFPMKFPIRLPVVLGMDFFLKHQVFIDFKKGYVHISPPNDTAGHGMAAGSEDNL